MQGIIINTIEKILKYLKPFLPTANCHMVDFYTSNIYNKYVSQEIRNELHSLDIYEALDAIWNPTKKYPALYEYINICKQHTLPSYPEVCLNLHSFEAQLIELGCLNLSGFHLETFMSSKKSHEVEILSKVASAVSEITDTKHFVDIGDGKGYLSSAMAIHKNMCVLGIDASVTNTEGAAKRIEKLNKILGKTENMKCDYDLYKQTTEYITENTNLNKLVLEHFPGSKDVKLGLVGLHTCGNLAPSCLRIFHANSNIRTICNVGCCYHLLTENSDDCGFPMSKFLKNKHFSLGRNARMIAGQSLDRMIHDRDIPSDILFYRSVLQVWLVKNAPELLECHAGRFKKPTNFVEYMRKNLAKFKCKTVPSDEEIMDLYNEYLPKMKDLKNFYMLRAHLAPVVEAVVILDRFLYLHECGYDKSYLVEMFDPVISPRCYGLVSCK